MASDVEGTKLPHADRKGSKGLSEERLMSSSGRLEEVCSMEGLDFFCEFIVCAYGFMIDGNNLLLDRLKEAT
jgi:hypothetical protein